MDNVFVSHLEHTASSVRVAVQLSHGMKWKIVPGRSVVADNPYSPCSSVSGCGFGSDETVECAVCEARACGGRVE